MVAHTGALGADAQSGLKPRCWQDDIACQVDQRCERPRYYLRDRRRSTDELGCGTNRVDWRSSGTNQHRKSLSPRCTVGWPGFEAIEAREGRDSLCRECRKSCMPGRFRSWRRQESCLGVGHRGRCQTFKIPQYFASSDLLVVTKGDLLPYVDFDSEACLRYAKRLKPTMEMIEISAKTGEGLRQWYDWLLLSRAEYGVGLKS
jgi:hypothetical protein